MSSGVEGDGERSTHEGSSRATTGSLKRRVDERVSFARLRMYQQNSIWIQMSTRDP